MRRDDPKNTNKRYFRSSARVFQMNGAWFYATREGDQGPFQSQSDAELAMSHFTTERVGLSGFQASRAPLVLKTMPTPEKRRVAQLKEQAAPRSDLVLELEGEDEEPTSLPLPEVELIELEVHAVS